MVKQRESVETVSEISVDPQPSGLRAVYLVETRNEEEAGEISMLFYELESQVQVRQLSEGRLMSYVVQAHESDEQLLDDIEAVLKSNYGFVVTQRSFDQIIHRIVTELTHDTGSELFAVPCCNICGKAEPFPTTIMILTSEDGSTLMHRNYCGSCTAGASAPNNKDFLRSLLAADEQDFSRLNDADLERHPSRKKSIKFKIKAVS